MDIIKEIEDKDYEINYDNYLHAFPLGVGAKILEEGIKCPKLVYGRDCLGFNGLYYISLIMRSKQLSYL